MQHKISLGDEVKDLVTGYKGIVLAITHWISGCDRLGIAGKAINNATPVEPYWVDVVQCKLLKKSAITIPKAQMPLEEENGGPTPAPRFYNPKHRR